MTTVASKIYQTLKLGPLTKLSQREIILIPHVFGTARQHKMFWGTWLEFMHT